LTRFLTFVKLDSRGNQFAGGIEMSAAVIYTRESSRATLPTDVKHANQEEDCRKYAQEHGMKVYKVYHESHSGADLDGRHMVWDAVADIESGEAQYLLVRNEDRLARKSQHSYVIEYMVEKAGGQVVAVLEPVDESDPNAVMFKDFKRAVAQAERMNAMIRMQRGTRKRAERGELMAGAVPQFGYDWLDDEVGKRTAFRIDEVSGPIVQRIFKLVLAGQSVRSIARLFNAEEVPTPSQVNAMRGHGVGREGRKGRQVALKWQGTLVARIVREPTYTGTVTAYKWTHKSKDDKRRMPTPQDSPNRIALAIPALIDQATFDAAQSILKSRITAGRPPKDPETSWLRGHVYCGVCGSRMIHYHVKDHGQAYACWNRKSGQESDTPCSAGGAITAHLIDQPVYEALCYLLTRRNWAKQLMVERLGIGKRNALAAMAEAYQAQLQAKRQELDQTLSLARQASPDLAARLLADAEQVNTAIHGLETEYAKANQQLEEFQAGQAWIQATLEQIAAHSPVGIAPTPEAVKEFPLEERRLLLAASGLRAEVYPLNWTGKREEGTRWGPGHKRVEVFFDWALDRQKMTGVISDGYRR
jgi:site-specific DNA recombinase